MDAVVKRDAVATRKDVAKGCDDCRAHQSELVAMDDAAIEIRQTEVYARWFAGLRDRRARARIDLRIRRMALGNPGDVRHVGGRISELRIDYGPGYRVYFMQQGRSVVVLVGGGDKRSQNRDIKRVRRVAEELPKCGSVG